MKVLPWLRLLRLPNLPTAVLDVAAGAAFGSAHGHLAGNWGAIVFAALASLGIYSAGLVLNDVADFEFDKKTRGQRPLPSGEISRTAASILAAALLALAAAAASRTTPQSALVLGFIAALSLLYNFALKHSPVLGPASLAACRAANWSVGLYAVNCFWGKHAGDALGPIAPVAAYFFYILFLSSFARMEDAEVKPKRCRIELAACFVPLLGMAVFFGRFWGASLLFAALLVWIGILWFRTPRWNREAVGKMTGSLLMGIYVIDAATAFPGLGWSSLLLLLPLPAAIYLRKTISPT